MSNRIYIVGIGPGREEMMTGEAIAALEQADVIVGYTVPPLCGRRQNAANCVLGRRKPGSGWH